MEFGIAALFIALIGFLLFMLVGFLILPIVLLVGAANNTALKNKTLWIVGMIFLWPLIQYIYGIAIEERRWLRVSSWLSLLFSVGILMAAIVATPSLITLYADNVAEMREEIEREEVTVDDRVKADIIDDLTLIETKLRNEEITLLSSEPLNFSLEKLGIALEDKNLTTQEYRKWRQLDETIEAMDK